MQLVKLDWQFNDSFVHCPFCGLEALVDDPCEHLLFIYGASEGELAYVADSLAYQVRQIVQKQREEDAEGDDEAFEFEDGDFTELWGIEDELVALNDARTSLAFMTVAGGMSCGPSADVSYYGFNACRPDL